MRVKNIGILGLNDIAMAKWENINLTTINNPFSQIIAASIEQVTALVEDQSITPKAHLFECSVIERGTLKAR